MRNASGHQSNARWKWAAVKKSEREHVLHFLLVGVCPPVLQIWPDFRPKSVIFRTRFQTRPPKSILVFWDLAFRQKLCYHYLDWGANKQILQIHFEFAYFSFFLTHLELKRKIRPYTPVVPSKTTPAAIPDQNGQSLYPFSDQNGANPSRWGGTYLKYSSYKGVPPPEAKQRQRNVQKSVLHVQSCFFAN